MQDVLKKPEYFGKFGKIHKVVINQNTAYAGSQTQVGCRKLRKDKVDFNSYFLAFLRCA